MRSTVSLIERDFTVRYAAGAPDREAFLREHGPNVRAAITNGSTGISAELIARLEQLHRMTAGAQADGGRQAAETAPDDQDAVGHRGSLVRAQIRRAHV